MTTKTVSVGYPRQRYNEIKVEFPGGIVHVRTGLTDRMGNEVVNVSVSADGNRYAGDPEWWAYWGNIDARGGGCRIIKGVHSNEKEETSFR